MTAITMEYMGTRFLIAADGRSRSDEENGPKDRETDEAQKVFPIDKENVKMAWALTGFSSTEDGKFDLVSETTKQIQQLAMSRFSESDELLHRVGVNLKRSLAKAIQDGTIKELKRNPHLAGDEKDRISRIFFLGYFRGKPLWEVVSFYHDEKTNRITVKRVHYQLEIGAIHSIGSKKISEMMYNLASPVDERLARYRVDPKDSVKFLTSYIEASSDPVAPEIDLVCQTIGGHMHVAEITVDEFKWLIPPRAG